ncbi:iron chelate uptake ABC transporter family permease subunit [Paracoccus sp. PAMC 22219]|uniref:iron chelate uptake ABC transporter family permease subunit n=1 Tax=Paracoccus sp. PAMC 22219 TaxID=1569209 RepID=UPI0035A73795
MTAPAAPLTRATGRAGMLLLLACAVVALCALSLAIGTRSVGWADLMAGLAGATDSIGQAAVAVRIPRTLMAAVAGAALGLSGAIMQGVTRNPLADPGILGINNGAALAVVIGIAWFGIAAASTFVWVAILGAGLTAVSSMAWARSGGGRDTAEAGAGGGGHVGRVLVADAGGGAAARGHRGGRAVVAGGRRRRRDL